MAGSKRTNIQGHTVVADPELVKKVRRHASALIGRLFREAQEHGQSTIELDGQVYVIIRRSDHTFSIGHQSGNDGFL